MSFIGTTAIGLKTRGHHAGTISGAMNTAGNIGGFCCGILFGEMVQQSGNYNLPLYMIAVMLIVSALLFAFINPEKPIIRNEK